MARPRKEVSWEEIDKLCTLQCTEEEIAQWCEVSVSTLYRRCLEEKEMGFDEYFAEKRGTGKISLRRAQWQSAHKGNPTMLIWLGKQYLGQRDKTSTELSGPDGKPIAIDHASKSDEQLKAEIAAMNAKLGLVQLEQKQEEPSGV